MARTKKRRNRSTTRGVVKSKQQQYKEHLATLTVEQLKEEIVLADKYQLMVIEQWAHYKGFGNDKLNYISQLAKNN